MFHRRSIIGFVLVVGVGCLLYWLASKEKKGNDSSSDRAATIVKEKYQPDSEISFGNSKETDRESISEVNKSVLIDRVMTVEGTWRSKPTAVAAVELSGKLTLLRELFQRKLSDTESVFCIISYIQTASMLSSLSLRDKLDVEGIDDILDDIGQRYYDHELPEVTAAANSAIVRRQFDRFINSNELGDLQQAEKTLYESLPAMLVSEKSMVELVGVMYAVRLKPALKEETLALAERLIGKLKESHQRFSKALASQVYLGGLDVSGLQKRVSQDTSDSRDDVIKLFEAFEKYPDFGPEVYVVAVTVIRIYQDRGQDEDAKDLLLWLERISEKVANPEQKAGIVEAIELGRKYVAPGSES